MRWILFFGLGIVCQSECLHINLPAYDTVGNSKYFIAEGTNSVQLVTWFRASAICQSVCGQLISIQSEEQMNALLKYILDRGYKNGTKFVTSGHNFLTPSPFKWEALQEPVTYSKWLPGDGPVHSSFLSLQLINSELFMVTSTSFDRYFICEYETAYMKLRKALKSTMLYTNFCSFVLTLLIILYLIISAFRKRTLSPYRFLK